MRRQLCERPVSHLKCESSLLAAQNGIENVAALLTDAISAEQLQMIAAVMDEHGGEAIEID